MSLDYSYAMGDSLPVLLSMLFQYINSALVIAGYVLSALALYDIAKRRGIKRPWLGWIPVADVWLYGSISDQYQYVTAGKVKSKRKILLTLEIIATVFLAALCAMFFYFFVDLLGMMFRIPDEEAIFKHMMSWLFGFIIVWLLSLPVSISLMVVQYMAVYDIYRSLNPKHTVLFLVLSIVFPVTMPFFLFFNRKKDLGMPPRRPDYAIAPPPAQQAAQWQQPVYGQPQIPACAPENSEDPRTEDLKAAAAPENYQMYQQPETEVIQESEVIHEPEVIQEPEVVQEAEVVQEPEQPDQDGQTQVL